MKILATHTSFRLYWEERLEDLHRRLNAAGHGLDVVELEGKSGHYGFAGARQRNQPFSRTVLFPEASCRDLPSRRMSRALYGALEKASPDMVLAGGIPFVSGATAVRWCRERRRPVVIMDNIRRHEVPRSRLVEWVKRRIYRNVDAVIVPGPSHRDSYVRWGVAPDRIHYGLNVIDAEAFRDKAEAIRGGAAAARRRLGLPDRYFLGVGRHVRAKNWDVLVAAYAEYRRSVREPYAFVIVGEGPERDRLAERLKGDAIRGVELRDFVARDELPAFYALAEAMILGSSFDTWPNVVSESLACGTPVLLTTACGCCEDLVASRGSGIPFEAGSVSGAFEAMRRFHQMTAEDRTAMSRAADAVIADWPLSRFADSVLRIIDRRADMPPLHPSLLDRMILWAWRGRYRPV